MRIIFSTLFVMLAMTACKLPIGERCPCAEGNVCCAGMCIAEGDTCDLGPGDQPDGGKTASDPDATPAPVDPGRPNAVVGLVIADGDTIYWYEDGHYVVRPGTPAVHFGDATVLESAAFTVPAGLSPNDIVGIAREGDALRAWYDNGTTSLGDRAALASAGTGTYSVPQGASPGAILEVVEVDDGAGGARSCALFTDGLVACGDASGFSVEDEHFETHPRIPSAALRGLASDAKGRLWGYYVDGSITEGTLQTLHAHRYRPGEVAGFGMSADQTFLWYRSGLVERIDGEPDGQASVSWSQHFGLPDRSMYDIAAMAVDGTADPVRFYAWLVDGTLLSASSPLFEDATETTGVTLPPDQQWDQLMGIGIDELGDTYSWYLDGTFAGGTVTDLAASRLDKNDFQLADHQSVHSVAEIAVHSATGKVWAIYADGSRSRGNTVNLARDLELIACDPALDQCAPLTCGSSDADECALGCHPILPRCYDIDASNDLEDHFALAQEGPDVVLPAGVTIDTDAGTITDANGDPIDVTHIARPAGGGGVPIAVFVAGSLHLHDATVTGSAALALVSDGPLIIDGLLDVGAHGSTSGPGAVTSSTICAGKDGDLALTTGNERYASGGGGGGGRVSGRPGGAVEGSIAGGTGGTGNPSAYLDPLRGGCPGGLGGGSTSGRGGGGGALQLVSRSEVRVTTAGAIRATGGGGQPGTMIGAGGSGGGGGGSVLIEAPAVTLEGGAILALGGGSGAGGCGAAGSDGALGNTVVPGGDCTAQPGTSSGGQGGVSGSAPGYATAGAAATIVAGQNVTAGGGGGAVGQLIVLAAGAAVDDQGAVLPGWRTFQAARAR